MGDFRQVASGGILAHGYEVPLEELTSAYMQWTT